MRRFRNNRKLPCLLFSAVLILFLVLECGEAFDDNGRVTSSDYDDGGDDENRIGGGCSKEDIVISQEAVASLPGGIPTYSVEIMNENVSGCSISDIHVSCGWFSTARMVNPRVFQRLAYDDCLVNDGEPLPPGRVLSFEYATTFLYPLSVSYVSCC